MELHEWAGRVFGGDCLEEKLLAPPGGIKALSDLTPGPAVTWRRPPRSGRLAIAPKGQRIKFPRPTAMDQQEMRVRSLHVFANHELMALEMMAWALLAFPEADASFRQGLAQVLVDEQRHFRLYCERLSDMGVTFGDLPVNDHFWRAGPDISNPLDWVCFMHLTFEQSNLDHAPFYGRLFQEAGDEASAALMQTIFEDEIHHVRFGARWLKHYQPEGQSLFQTFSQHCAEINPPARGKGLEFQEEARRAAGLDDDFIQAMRECRG
ncbi:MAG: DUF455 family protein [Candidatus Eremiobacteraeota bacterium]|nr:DUF455 family protein [Candidatus Eremiobacteraeota bacterium]